MAVLAPSHWLRHWLAQTPLLAREYGLLYWKPGMMRRRRCCGVPFATHMLIFDSGRRNDFAVVRIASLQTQSGALEMAVTTSVSAILPQAMALGNLDGAGGLDLALAVLQGNVSGLPEARVMKSTGGCAYASDYAVILGSAPRDIVTLVLDNDSLETIAVLLSGNVMARASRPATGV